MSFSVSLLSVFLWHYSWDISFEQDRIRFLKIHSEKSQSFNRWVWSIYICCIYLGQLLPSSSVFYYWPWLSTALLLSLTVFHNIKFKSSLVLLALLIIWKLFFCKNFSVQPCIFQLECLTSLLKIISTILQDNTRILECFNSDLLLPNSHLIFAKYFHSFLCLKFHQTMSFFSFHTMFM